MATALLGAPLLERVRPVASTVRPPVVKLMALPGPVAQRSVVVQDTKLPAAGLRVVKLTLTLLCA
jgi:hypothetical protein